jgi:hypothetical protein
VSEFRPDDAAVGRFVDAVTTAMKRLIDETRDRSLYREFARFILHEYRTGTLAEDAALDKLGFHKPEPAPPKDMQGTVRQ